MAQNNIFNRNQNQNPPAQVEIQGEEAVLNPSEKPEEGKSEERVKLPKTTWK